MNQDPVLQLLTVQNKTYPHTTLQGAISRVFRLNGMWDGGMEQWNGIVEWATMINDPVLHHLFAHAHYAAQLEQSQKGERE